MDLEIFSNTNNYVLKVEGFTNWSNIDELVINIQVDATVTITNLAIT